MNTNLAIAPNLHTFPLTPALSPEPDQTEGWYPLIEALLFEVDADGYLLMNGPTFVAHGTFIFAHLPRAGDYINVDLDALPSRPDVNGGHAFRIVRVLMPAIPSSSHDTDGLTAGIDLHVEYIEGKVGRRE